MSGAVAVAPARGRLRWSQVRATYERAALGLLGLGATLPLYLTPGSTSGPRLGDLALLAALPLVLVEGRGMPRRFQAAGGIAVFGLVVTLLLQASRVGEKLNASDAVFWFRWIASAAIAPAAASLILKDVRRRRLFFAALMIGAGGHVATYGLSLWIGREALQAVGLASPRAAITTVAAHVRLTTLAEHPNAAMIMIGLAVPAGILLAGRRWIGAPTTVFGAALAILGFMGTLSRAGLLAAGLSWAARAVVGWRWGERVRPLGVALVLCVVVAGGLAARLSGIRETAPIAERFDRAQLADNLAGRAATWRRSVDLILDRPLGAGWSTADEMGAFRAQSVSHNGYLFTARTLGVLAGVILLGLHLMSAARLDGLTPLSIYGLAAMFSEDVTQGAGMVFLSCLVAALAWRRPSAP